MKAESYLAFRGKECPYCAEPMEWPRGAPTRDHVFPRARGGELTDENKIICCRTCNQDKGDMTLVEFVFHLRRRGDRRVPVVSALLFGRRFLVDERILGYAPPTGWRWFDELRAHARQNGSLLHDAPQT